MILNFHKTNDSAGVIIGIEHLALLEWKGDDKMFEFRALWNSIMRRMTDTLSELTLRGMLLKKMRTSKYLKEDIAHYDRLEEADSNKNTTYLWNCISRAIRIQNEKRNAAQHEDFMKAELGGRGNSAAPSQAETKKGKKAAKAAKAAQEAAPAPTPKPKTKAKAKPKPKDDWTRDENDDSKVCFFFNHQGCNKDKDACTWKHVMLSAKKREAMVRPSRSGSPAGRSPEGGRGKGKGKGKSKGGSRNASPAPGAGRSASPGAPPPTSWCHKFLLGTCDHKPCKFKHMSQEQVDKILKLRNR